MTIITETYVPYEFNKYETLKYIESRAQGIRKSIRRVEIEKESGHLILRCPLSGDYLEVAGNADEIAWLDNELAIRKWYRVS